MSIDLELHRNRIGGSEAPVIADVDDWCDPFGLWAKKVGGLPPAPPTMRMRIGKLLERPLAELYSQETKREIEWWDKSILHPDYDFMVATPDALCVDEPRGLECKVVSFDQRSNWGETADEIPYRVQVQCYWYLAATGRTHWDVAALIGNDDFRIYTIKQDLELQAFLLRKVEAWWKRYIIGGERPPIGGSAVSDQYLRQRFPRNKSAIREATLEEIDLLTTYAQARADKDIACDRQEELENQIKLAIGDADGLQWRHGRFTWKASKDTTECDWKALAKSLMASRPDAERKLLEQEFTSPKPGTRRIHWTYSGPTE